MLPQLIYQALHMAQCDMLVCHKTALDCGINLNPPVVRHPMITTCYYSKLKLAPYLLQRHVLNSLSGQQWYLVFTFQLHLELSVMETGKVNRWPGLMELSDMKASQCIVVIAEFHHFLNVNAIC